MANISLTVNGHEIRGYIAADGISKSTIERRTKSVIVTDGTDFRTSRKKHKIDVTLLDDMIGSAYTELQGWLATNPASVTYYDYEKGITISGTFYIVDNTYQIKKSYGSDCLISGASFSLEEK